MEKQLCINRLTLPEELLTLIKEFAFLDVVSYTALYRKKIIHSLIQGTPWSHRGEKYYRYMFWIEQDTKCKQYQMVFCEQCGDYISKQTNYDYEKLYCTCNF